MRLVFFPQIANSLSINGMQVNPGVMKSLLMERQNPYLNQSINGVSSAQASGGGPHSPVRNAARNNSKLDYVIPFHN